MSALLPTINFCSDLFIQALLVNLRDDAVSKFVRSSGSLLGHAVDYYQQSTTRCLPREEAVVRLNKLAQW